MFRNLVLLNAFYLYASVTVYMAVIGAAAPVYGKAALAELNLFFMASTALGIFVFGFLRERFPEISLRSFLLGALGVNGASVAALLPILTAGSGVSLRFAFLHLVEGEKQQGRTVKNFTAITKIHVMGAGFP